MVNAAAVLPWKRSLGELKVEIRSWYFESVLGILTREEAKPIKCAEKSEVRFIAL
jgi:hypothetical protein